MMNSSWWGANHFGVHLKKKAHPVCDVAEFHKQTSGSMV